MDDLRLQAVAARVVAWHNRHPLARRISASQVKSVGYVALSVGAEAAAAPLPSDALAPAAPTLASLPADAGAVESSPAEADYAAAFAALAEHPAPAAQAAAAGFEIELDVTDEVVADAALAPESVPAEAAVAEPALPPATAARGDAQAAVDAAAGEVATLAAPDPAALPKPEPGATLPLHIPTLRDRVQTRAQQPAVQGALLTAHDGYRPTVHPQAHAPVPAGGGSAAEHGDGDRFMAPLSPRALARWVARQGRALLQAPVDGPIRRVSTAAVAGGPTSGTTYVLTAAIAGGGLTSRVLVGAGSPGAVLGARLWSTPRVATAAALGAVLLAAAAAVAASWVRPAEHLGVAVVDHGDAPAAAASAAASAAAAAEPDAAASASAAADAPAATAALAAASAATGAAGAEAVSPEHGAAAPTGHAPATDAPAPPDRELVVTTTKPLPAYAKKGLVGLPERALPLSEEDKAAARAAVAAARAGRPAAPPRAAATPPAGEAPEPAARPDQAAAPPAAARAEAPAALVFALSTRSLRTRAEAEQLQAAITALLGSSGASRHVDLLPEGDDWRVVAWPFPGPAEADRARALLTGRGMKVEVMRF